MVAGISEGVAVAPLRVLQFLLRLSYGKLRKRILPASDRFYLARDHGTLGAFENRMASLLFKMAVELSMSLHVTAANSEIDEGTLAKLRGLCVDEVKRIRGAVSFDDAYKFQKG